ncbi:acyltransferase [Sinomonas sp. R1AF57]|uniref:acyltransferase family protein n=1 Tax=Sinomonas sp. R1AF57 TaxID=2020377 RepID=UPI001ABF5307|nr:acyltransferase [Sinomonas sp. R1AF57]
MSAARPAIPLGTRTLGEALTGSGNSLNALRLAFAACVIISHAWWLGGYGPEPALFGIKLGTAGVMGFFAISGYLITVSAGHSTAFEYATARFSRIYPGLVVSAVLVAFVAAPLGALISRGRYSLSGAVAFLESALGLLIGTADTPPIGTSLLGNNDRLDWNGPLWTLTWEVLCYVLVGLAVFLAKRFSPGGRSAPLVVLWLFAAASGAVAGKILGGGFGPNRLEFVLPFVAIFMASSLLATIRHRVRVGPLPGFAAIVAVWAAYSTGYGTALAPLPFAYAVLSIGSLPQASRIGSRHDISYGVYIYGWPVQQLLAAARIPLQVPVLVYAALALVLVAPIGFLSCLLVEKPAQRVLRALPARCRKAAPEPSRYEPLGHKRP